jgi:hypothetical protein
MSRVVWKYAVGVDDEWYPLPEGGQVVGLRAGSEVDELLVWVLQDEAATPKSSRQVRVFGTGHPVPDGAVHRGMLVAGRFVWHLFELDRPDR